jgi:hypothetical protein
MPTKNPQIKVKPVKRNGWRHKQYWNWAKEWQTLFESLFPEHVCEAAMATCRFQLRGLDSHGNKWGLGVVTFLQTFGHIPIGLVNDVQIHHNWIELDAHDSADLILGCFGLSMQDVYDHYGTPPKGHRIDLDLYNLVTAIEPGFVEVAQEIAA